MQLRKWLLIAGISCLVLGGLVAASIAYFNSNQRSVPLVFSNQKMLSELWYSSKKNNLEPGTYRTLDKTQQNITTSEGESYTMLRSVWMDDKDTFDKSWQWTKDNLQRSDHLMSWKFGKLPNGKYGVRTDIGGQNTASDADGDIALALTMAYSRWNNSTYLSDARPIINSIWEKEVVIVAGKPVLTADDLESAPTNGSVVVNPSYFAPYTYKIFSKIDNTPGHNWAELANNSYSVLEKTSASPLDKTKSDGLPPNWIRMDRQSGLMSSAGGVNNTDYSYDAMRTPFRLALDWQWFKDPRAKQLLKQFGYLEALWQKQASLSSDYAHDGSDVSRAESPSVYGGDIGYFMVTQPASFKAIYNKKLLTLYSPDKQSWTTTLNYYDDNWVWFGLALSQQALTNLAVTT